VIPPILIRNFTLIFTPGGEVGLHGTHHQQKDAQQSAICTSNGLSYNGEHVARVWDTKSCRRLQEFRGHTDTICSVRFSPDGRLLVTASGDLTARVWDIREGQSVAIFRGHSGLIFDASFSPDNRKVLTASADGTARIYDASFCRPLAEAHPTYAPAGAPRTVPG
jgi:WD40 repeat protein